MSWMIDTLTEVMSMVFSWGISGNVLSLLEDDLEETYHALFMQSAIEEAGIDCKVIKGFDGLKWGANSEVLDADGTPIKWVWKTWAWETALDQIRDQLESSSNESTNLISKTNANPRLVDALLGDGVYVFEPFWTLIPSNKAILPILWQLYPNHSKSFGI